MKTTLAITIFAAVAALGCAKQETTAQAATAQPAATPAPAVAAASPDAITGSILETMDVGGYTYMKLQTAAGETWVATPQAAVKVGEIVTVDPQMTSENFESGSLKRTFDKLVFATMAGGNAATAPAMPAGMGGMMGGGTPAEHMKPNVDIGDVNVPKAEGANAYTVADVWTSRATLGGKEVAVRGKVVKFLGGIMGTNFVHVRDGSGSDAKGDNDLTVTTNEQLAVGDVVTLTGKVSVDKDLGAGYQYPVIVENAKVTK